MGLLGETGSTTGGETSGGNTSGSTTGGQTTTQTTTTSGGGAQVPAWMSGFGDDLKGHEGLRQFTDPQNLAKSWVHAQSQLGKKRVAVPSEKASEEEWAAFHKELGVPDPDKYELKLPEGVDGNSDYVKKFKEHVQKSGLLPRQAEAVAKFYVEQEKAEAEAKSAQYKEMVTKGLEKLKSEWGAGFDKQIALGDMALRELAGEEGIKQIVAAGLHQDPMFIRLMAKAGALMGEDKLRGSDAKRFNTQSPAELQRELDLIMAKPEYFDTTHAGHKRAVEDAANISKKLYG